RHCRPRFSITSFCVSTAISCCRTVACACSTSALKVSGSSRRMISPWLTRSPSSTGSSTTWPITSERSSTSLRYAICPEARIELSMVCGATATVSTSGPSCPRMRDMTTSRTRPMAIPPKMKNLRIERCPFEIRGPSRSDERDQQADAIEKHGRDCRNDDTGRERLLQVHRHAKTHQEDFPEQDEVESAERLLPARLAHVEAKQVREVGDGQRLRRNLPAVREPVIQSHARNDQHRRERCPCDQAEPAAVLHLLVAADLRDDVEVQRENRVHDEREDHDHDDGLNGQPHRRHE